MHRDCKQAATRRCHPDMAADRADVFVVCVTHRSWYSRQRSSIATNRLWAIPHSILWTSTTWSEAGGLIQTLLSGVGGGTPPSHVRTVHDNQANPSSLLPCSSGCHTNDILQSMVAECSAINPGCRHRPSQQLQHFRVDHQTEHKVKLNIYPSKPRTMELNRHHSATVNNTAKHTTRPGAGRSCVRTLEAN